MDPQHHDPVTFATQLGAKLATRSRHACLLLGAGASRACGLPDVAGLETAIKASLGEADSATFAALCSDRSLEEVLSRLRRIVALLGDGQELEGLSGTEAARLDKEICQAVVEALQVAKADTGPMGGLASWVAGAEYHRPVELFTVNYDLLIETALERLSALWFDGFVGSVSAPFRIDLVEGGGIGAQLPSEFARVWKLHGSLNWCWDEDARSITRRSIPPGEDAVAAIYPADTKYEESRRVPYVVLMDRFRRALQEPETLLLVSGYSFGDEHLDELIFEAAARRPRSEFIAFCYSQIPANLAEKASSVPSLTVVSQAEAIIGSERRPWKAEEEIPGVWEGGKFKLGDFAHLGGFLARNSRLPDPTDG